VPERGVMGIESDGVLTPEADMAVIGGHGRSPTADAANLIDAARRKGSEFAVEWVERASPDEIRAVFRNEPQLPAVLDSVLLRAAVPLFSDTLGRDLPKEIRHALRAGFWEAIKHGGLGEKLRTRQLALDSATGT
jgi:hypothetical protein